MGDVIDRNGFRVNVGIVLMDPGGRLFLGRRAGGRGWQFPQGGVLQGEAPEDSLYRELHEEIGLGRDDVELLGQTSRWLRYRLPRRFVRRDSRPLCIGQKQRWFLLRAREAQPAFRFDTTGEPEFDRWRWVDYWQPVREVVYFKRPVYVRALQELAPLAGGSSGAPPKPDWWREGAGAAPGPAGQMGQRDLCAAS